MRGVHLMLTCRELIFFMMIFPGVRALGQLAAPQTDNSLYTSLFKLSCKSSLNSECAPYLPKSGSFDEKKIDEALGDFCNKEADKLDDMLAKQAQCESEAGRKLNELGPERLYEEKKYIASNPWQGRDRQAAIDILNALRALTPSYTEEAKQIFEEQKDCFEANVLPSLGSAQAEVKRFDEINQARLACSDIMSWPNQNRASFHKQFGEEEANRLMRGYQKQADDCMKSVSQKYNLPLSDLNDDREFSNFMRGRPDYSGNGSFLLTLKFGDELRNSGSGDSFCMSLIKNACFNYIMSPFTK